MFDCAVVGAGAFGSWTALRLRESDHIAGELGQVLAGRIPTILKPLGQAVEDVAAAHLAYARAMSMGRGVPLV